jgi:Cu(I)/Ag(I) efflux system membrane fusion protein
MEKSPPLSMVFPWRHKMTPAKVAASIILAAGIFVAGYMANRHPIPVATSASAKQAVRYTCPMHPQYTSDRSGECPICGMRLEQIDTADVAVKADNPVTGAPGIVRINAEKQQLIGVRTDTVKTAPVSDALRVPGRITVDDQRLYRIVASVDGWIRELGPNPAGAFVAKDQVLASYYTQNLITAAQTYAFAVQSNVLAQSGDKTIGLQRGTVALTLQAALDSVRSLGMSERQIQEIDRTGIAPTLIHIYSPIDGFVISRNVSPEQRFDKGTEMYRIADIGHVWVMTDVFEKDRAFLKPGARATVYYQDRRLQAHMSDALPQFDPQSRTLKTRFELDNPGFVLRPDMFVDVELHVEMPAAITVPADSVIDLGRRKTVYVQSDGGRFEPRIIDTGWRLGDRVQVTSGLEAGERIVVSSNFLVDSESRMKLSALSTELTLQKVTAAKDPVCGMEIDPKAADAFKTQYNGRTYYFCAPKCRRDFDENPRKYVHENMAAQDGSGARDH